MKFRVTLPDGATRDVEAKPGQSLMVAMREGGIPVRAECGGAMACASCHVVPADAWVGRLGPAGEYEADLLDGSEYRVPNSRLSCQIKADDSLDGLQLTLQLDAFEG